jgi:hypothetical protein
MSVTKTCDNPKCCTCTVCGCGVAHLGPAELRVMEILWPEPGGELTGRNVADPLPDYVYTTVATMLDRLCTRNSQVGDWRAAPSDSSPVGHGLITPQS